MASLFKDREKYDGSFSMRAPQTLVSKTAEIARDERKTANEARVRLLEAGTAAYEWVRANANRLERLWAEHPETRDLDLPELVVALLEMSVRASEAAEYKQDSPAE
jgi:hypothetical protein